VVRRVDIVDVTFLSKDMILLGMRDREPDTHGTGGLLLKNGTIEDADINGTCKVLWMLRMLHWLSDSGILLPKVARCGGPTEERWDYIPAFVKISSGMVVEDVKLLLDLEFPGRDLLAVWTVMES
jgi:hypothetical protein